MHEDDQAIMLIRAEPQDAIGCTRLNEAAGEAMIASVSDRFGA